jgi:PhnB protein
MPKSQPEGVPNPPEGVPRLAPFLYYTDVAAALDWLETAFGFERLGEIPDSDGAITHAVMGLQDALVMVEPARGEHRSPKELPGVNQSLYVFVDDVDEHYRCARDAGALNITEPEDTPWGNRVYSARDLEGHHWAFAQNIGESQI